MRVTVSSAVLREHVSAACNFIAQRPSLPVLSNILIGAKGKRLTFYATDLDASLMTGAEVGGTEEGRITLPAAQLSLLVGKLPVADVTIASENGVDVELRCARSKFRLRGYAAEQYPDPIKPKGKPDLVLPARMFGALITQVLYASKGEEGALGGLHVMLEAGRLTAMAADGYRMTVWSAEVPQATGAFRDTMPTRVLRELGKLLKGEGEGDVSVFKHGDNQLGFQVGESYLVSKLIAHAYPDFRPVIPKVFDAVTTLNRAVFMGAVDRVSVMTGSGEQANLLLRAAGNELTVLASGSDVGGGEEVVACSPVEAPFEVTLRAPWLLEALKNLPNDDVNLCFKAGAAPVVLRPALEGGIESPLTAAMMPTVL